MPSGIARRGPIEGVSGTFTRGDAPGGKGSGELLLPVA